MTALASAPSLAGLSARRLRNALAPQAGLALQQHLGFDPGAGLHERLALGNAVAARYGERVTDAVRAYAAAEIVIGLTGVGVYLLPRSAHCWRRRRPLLDDLVSESVAWWSPFSSCRSVDGNGRHVAFVMQDSAGVREDGFGAVLGESSMMEHARRGCRRRDGARCISSPRWESGNRARCGGAESRRSPSRPDGSRQCRLPQRFAPESIRLRFASSTTGWLWLAAAFLSGFCLLALEVVWCRLLLLVVMGDSAAFAIMLGIVLVGIALGGLMASVARPRRDADRFAAAIAFTAALSCAVCYRALPLVSRRSKMELIQGGRIARVGVPLMFPVSLSGLFFTLSVRVRASRDVR